MVLIWGQSASPGDVWQHLEMFLVVPTRGGMRLAGSGWRSGRLAARSRDLASTNVGSAEDENP